MAKFYELFINFVLIGLVVLSLFSFAIFFQDENDASDKFIENSRMNDTYSDLRDNLADFREDSQSQKSLFERENPTESFGSILLFSVVSAGKVFNSMIIGIFNTLIVLPAVFLGVSPVVISVISTLLILTIIFGLWIIYKLGG